MHCLNSRALVSPFRRKPSGLMLDKMLWSLNGSSITVRITNLILGKFLFIFIPKSSPDKILLFSVTGKLISKKTIVWFVLGIQFDEAFYTQKYRGRNYSPIIGSWFLHLYKNLTIISILRSTLNCMIIWYCVYITGSKLGCSSRYWL